VRDRLATAAICLVFAVVFGAVGAGASWVIGKSIHDGMRAQDWVLVKATVDAFNGRQVSYRYSFQGREYKGDRMGTEILGGSDNLDSWHADMDNLLTTAKKEGKPITIYVNPDNPAESMIDRAIRWKLMLVFLPFALGFGGVGVGALGMLVKTLVFGGARNSSQPMSRVGSQVGGVAAQWAFAILWNVISIPIGLMAVQDAIDHGNWLLYLVLFFPLIGFFMVLGALSSTFALVRAAFTSSVAALRPARAAAAPQPAPEPAATPAPSIPGSPSTTSTVFARGLIKDDPPPSS
jgi:hypothetical protein